MSITPDEIHRISKIPTLKVCALYAPSLGSDSLESLAHNPKKRYTFFDAGRIVFANNETHRLLWSLRTPERWGNLISPTPYAFARQLREMELKCLDVACIPESLDFSELAAAQHITHLHLSGSWLEPFQWQQIWNAKQLKQLAVKDCNLDDEIIEGILSLPNLEAFYLENVPITDRGLEIISRHPNLQTLSFSSRCRDGVARLVWMSPGLGFRIPGRRSTGPYLTAQGLASLSQLPNLHELKLNLIVRGKEHQNWKLQDAQVHIAEDQRLDLSSLWQETEIVGPTQATFFFDR